MSKTFTVFFSLAAAAASFAQTDILNEDFQSGIPSSWTIVNADQQTPNAEVQEYTNAWIIKADPENTTDSVASSTSYFTTSVRASRWLITPAITLGNYGNILSWNAKSHDPSYPENYKVLISGTGANIEDFQDTVRLIVIENPQWTAREINISNLGFNGQTVHLAFVNTTIDGFKLYLDDIRVRKNDPAGVEELELDAAVYPNPAQEGFAIQGASEIDRVYLYSSVGKLVSETAYQNGAVVNISGIDPGIYFVKMRSGEYFKTERLIKK